MTVETIDLRRVGTALIVIVLHGLLSLALLRETLHQSEKPPTAREVVLRFIHPPRPATAPKPEVVPPPLPFFVSPSSVAPNPGSSAPAPTKNGATLHGLYFFLYECTPENFAHLTEEERAR